MACELALVLLMSLLPTPDRAQSNDDDFRIYAVNVVKTPPSLRRQALRQRNEPIICKFGVLDLQLASRVSAFDHEDAGPVFECWVGPACQPLLERITHRDPERRTCADLATLSY